MTELEKWELINLTTTKEELKKAILLIADSQGNIMGRQKPWPAKQQADFVDGVISGSEPPHRLTRAYGIRQQALYLQ